MNPQNRKEMLIYRAWLLLYALLGELYKLLVNFGILRPHKLSITNENHPKIIVSLTSYGRRVHTVYYTIISLLRQTLSPDMVILWLDDENWSDDKLPKSLKKLCSCGLTIKYCKDIKSYKKLIPALQQYPDALIVTCDDDIYYRRNMVERLVVAYEENPTNIYAHRAHLITFDSKGKLNSYNNWPEEISNVQGKQVFPTSGGGTLYTKELLYKDMCNEDLFSQLAPKADDVWNYFMGLLQHTPNVVLPYKGYIYLPLDVFYQFFHRSSNLAYSNYNECMNDVQIKAIMDYYHLKSTDLH